MMRRVILPLVIGCCFIFESIFTMYFPDGSFGENFIIVPHFLLVALLLMGVYYSRNRAILFAFIFGLLFDVFYTGVLGVYMFLFPLSVYIADKMMKILQNNLFVAALVIIINISLVEFLVYEMNLLILKVPMTIIEFLENRLLPTLALNVIFFIIMAWPFKLLFSKMSKYMVNE
jgi:rod shape-determining protein MreD